MKKIEVGKCEIQTGSLIMGAVAATGIGLIALGVKSFFDAKKISLIEEDSFDDEEEFEEYKFRKSVWLFDGLRWKELGEVPETALAGPGIAATASGLLVTGGELKPGVRSPKTFTIAL